MRRSTPDLQSADELRGPELPALDPEFVIHHLEPLVTAERSARILGVLARRFESVTVVLDGPHDPHNGAAVLRSCDAFGVQKFHIIERYERFLNARSISRGTEQWVDVALHPDTATALAALGGRYELVATEPGGELVPSDLKAIPRLALVVGNEHEGIAPELRRHCSKAVRVPMLGFVDSLNLSVSTAILLSTAVEGRAGDLPEAERRRLYARGLYLTVPRAAEVLLAAQRRP